MDKLAACLLCLSAALAACGKKKPEAARTQPAEMNVVERYADGLQKDARKAQEARDKYNTAVKEREKEVQRGLESIGE